MNKRRLLKLAAFLRTVPRKAFAIDHWVTTEATKPEGVRPGDCGFAGCAMGWAAHAKLFRGLELNMFAEQPVEIRYKGEEGFSAAAKLFDIQYFEAKELFSPNFYIGLKGTPAQVAKRIERLVETGETGA